MGCNPVSIPASHIKYGWQASRSPGDFAGAELTRSESGIPEADRPALFTAGALMPGPRNRTIMPERVLPGRHEDTDEDVIPI